MKKLSLLIIILVATCTVALAQPRAIGLRLAWGIGASYQHSIGEKNMIQVDLDFPAYYAGIQATATYNWVFPISSWSGSGSWNWYAGVGLGAGYMMAFYKFEVANTWKNVFAVDAIAGVNFLDMIDLSYTIKVKPDFKHLMVSHKLSVGYVYRF